jgi:hypothetical protein
MMRIVSPTTDIRGGHAAWLTELAAGHELFALSVLAFAWVVRIVTNPRIFVRPSTLDEVLAFIGEQGAAPGEISGPTEPVGRAG